MACFVAIYNSRDSNKYEVVWHWLLRSFSFYCMSVCSYKVLINISRLSTTHQQCYICRVNLKYTYNVMYNACLTWKELRMRIILYTQRLRQHGGQLLECDIVVHGVQNEVATACTAASSVLRFIITIVSCSGLYVHGDGRGGKIRLLLWLHPQGSLPRSRVPGLLFIIM